MIIDIDEFKKVNDNYGHQQGDIVLVEVAQILADSIRKPDTLARYGGEEFAVILPQASVEDAKIIAERLRLKMEGYSFSSDSLKDLTLTISLGFVQYKKGMSKKRFVEYADKALYMAKQKGKNAYCVYV